MNIEIIILLAMMFTTIFLIYKSYQNPVNSKDYIVTVYLYICVALLFIAVMAKYAATLHITDPDNIFKMVIAYFVLTFVGISMMISNTFFVNHIGFLLMLLGLSLSIGTSTRYATNVPQAAMITALIVAVLTAIVFISSEERLIQMSEWVHSLLWILISIILIQLAYILISGGNETFYKIMSVSVIILFGFFILSDTSRLILQSKNLTCTTHSCINYPLKSSSLLLDYINIFVRMLSMNNK